jgi:hypothetical protein
MKKLFNGETGADASRGVPEEAEKGNARANPSTLRLRDYRNSTNLPALPL